MPVREAFRHSVNLVFIRLMRDMVYYYMYDVPGSTAKLFEDIHNPQREQYLLRFIDQESQIFLHRFYRKYAGQLPEDILTILLDRIRLTPERLATVFGILEPESPFEAFAAFMQAHLQQPLAAKTLHSLYTKYATAPFTLGDRGYLTRTHPLELWLAAYLRHHPQASRQEVTSASATVRREVYQWLFKTRHKRAQDVRIRTLLEAEAFLEIHRTWQRLGYPFPSLVPSYATAIGSSGDRPEALAELMGIIVNDGVRLPAASIEQMHFAIGTPYETHVGLAPQGEQVLPQEVAAVVKQALFDVVEHGTARRGYGSFRQVDGSLIPLGGKTGTGDHRHKGKLGARAVSRAGTFVFMIDNRFFGTLTAYVTGPESAQYHFTSALPVQVLKLLAPVLQPLMHTPLAAETDTMPPHAPPTPASTASM
jgi:membrane peptidoglycan carboxypeptidase